MKGNECTLQKKKRKKKKIQTVSHEPWYEVLSMLAIRLYLIAGLKILPEV